MSRSLIDHARRRARGRSSTRIAAAKRSRCASRCSCSPTRRCSQAVIAAQKRGVKVRVMLNPARRGGEPENEATRKKLEKAGIEVLDSNPDFAVTHEKSMVIDDETAFVKSLNWETQEPHRDARLRRRHRRIATRSRRSSSASRPTGTASTFEPDPHAHLIWCPLNGRDRIAAVHRRGEAHALRAERALPGPGHHRAAGARRAPGREDPPHGAPAAHAEEGQARRRRRRAAHPGRRRRQGAQAQGSEAARQDAPRRRRARDRGLDQPRARQLRQPARAGDRGRRPARRQARCTRSRSTTGSIRTRSISPTRACSPISRSAAGKARRSSR